MYVSSYLIWSRIGIAAAAKQGLGGYYFVEPSDGIRETLQVACCIFYLPLIEAERFLGTGRQPASIPMKGLSR
jgi:hypothetical protein